MLSDLRYALRSLRKSPGFVLVATLSLGLALALNTTTFAILDATLHPPVPVKDADRLFEVAMWGYGPGAGAPMSEKLAVLRSGTFCEDLAVVGWGGRAAVRAGDHVEEQWVPRASPNLFPMLGVRPELGRLIEPGSPDNVALVSHDEWERALGGRPLDGLTIWVGERQYQVIGVLPPEMKLRNGGPQQDVWIPAPAGWISRGGVMVLLKLKRGWTRAATSEQLKVLAHRLTLEYGSGPVPYAFSLRSILPYPRHLRPIHVAMAGAAFLVLLIACVNLASLMLVRGIVKRRELALRMAIGAGRGTLVRQLFFESVLVAAVGTALGVVQTAWAIALLYHHMPPSVTALGITRPHASWRVFVASLGLASATLMVFGLWPAVRASDLDVSEPLKENSPSATAGHRGGYIPVIAEVALSLVLLMGTALLTRAAERRSEAMAGLDRAGLLDALVWSGGDEPAASAAYNLEARVGAVPGVRSVATYRYGGNTAGATAMSEAYDGPNGLVNHTSVLYVGAGFLRTLGIPVLRGRGFLPGDEHDAVAIVDEAAARWLWPDAQGVGRQVKLGGPDSTAAWYRVVGVARTAPAAGPTPDPFLPNQGTIYVASRPEGRTTGWRLAVRVEQDNGRTEVALLHAMRDALGPRGGVMWLQPWQWQFDAAMRAHHFLINVFGSFSAFALLLAAMGLYGVVSYRVAQRMREFAVRIAVGAPSRDVMKLVAHDAAVMILAGTGLGALVAMWASKLLGDWLYNVPHTDAVALVTAEIVLLLAGLAASLQPALRAMRANPVEILRAI